MHGRRPPTLYVVGADQILVIESGRIVQRGTHKELLETHGLYERLYEEQFLPAAVG